VSLTDLRAGPPRLSHPVEAGLTIQPRQEANGYCSPTFSRTFPILHQPMYSRQMIVVQLSPGPTEVGVSPAHFSLCSSGPPILYSIDCHGPSRPREPYQANEGDNRCGQSTDQGD